MQNYQVKNTDSLRGRTNGSQTHEKMLNFTHERNANQATRRQQFFFSPIKSAKIKNIC